MGFVESNFITNIKLKIGYKKVINSKIQTTNSALFLILHFELNYLKPLQVGSVEINLVYLIILFLYIHNVAK